MKKIAVILGLFLGAAGFSADFARAAHSDIYTGTLEIVNGHPLLVRCDLARNTYILVDEKGEKAPYVQKLTELGAKGGRNIQASVRGVAQKAGEEMTLVVEEIEEVKAGNCHLTDQLD